MIGKSFSSRCLRDLPSFVSSMDDLLSPRLDEEDRGGV
jgi:hypothetical protein